MKLYVIRHGQTTGDVEGRYGGAYDDLLSPLGERQVEALAAELAGAGIERIFASSLRRAQQTAQAMAGFIHCPVTTLPDLQERDNYGPMTGLTKAEAVAQYPDFVEIVKDRLNTVPCAESYAAASARMTRGYNDAVAQAKECAAIVWHGGGMRVLFRDILEKGELAQIGDCAWVELEGPAPDRLQIKRAQRLDFAFDY